MTNHSPSYKPSGVDWLRNIPTHWGVRRLKTVLAQNDGGVWGDEPGDEGTIVLRSTEQTIDGGWEIDDPAIRSLTANEKTNSALKVGDLVVTKSSGSARHIGKTSLVTDQVAELRPCFSNFMQRLRCSEELEPRIAWYLLNSPVGRQQLILKSNSTTGLANLSGSILGELLIPFSPSTAEQRTIADYLDTETARIDTLISKKRHLIELLAEYRTALITQTVTRGLDPSPRLRPSGVDWLGDIPNHWGSPKISHVAVLGSGHTPSRSAPDWWVPQECTVPWITTGEVANLRSDHLEYIERTRECISEIGLANSSAVVHPADTVVLSRTASVGYSGIMATDMATSQDFATWTCGPNLMPRFLLLCLRAMRPDLLGRLTMGSTHKTIYMPDIRSLAIPLPPIVEQHEIVNAVWKQLERLVEAEDRITTQISLLREYRQALISAAVTGELTVQN